MMSQKALMWIIVQVLAAQAATLREAGLSNREALVVEKKR